MGKEKDYPEDVRLTAELGKLSLIELREKLCKVAKRHSTFSAALKHQIVADEEKALFKSGNFIVSDGPPEFYPTFFAGKLGSYYLLQLLGWSESYGISSIPFAALSISGLVFLVKIPKKGYLVIPSDTLIEVCRRKGIVEGGSRYKLKRNVVVEELWGQLNKWDMFGEEMKQAWDSMNYL
jgi:hypothetical protein